MDRFSCLRCLSNHIDLNYIIGSFAAGTTNPLVAKNLTKFFFYIGVSRGKIWLWLSYTFFGTRVSQFYTPNFTSLLAKLMTWQPFCDSVELATKLILHSLTPWADQTVADAKSLLTLCLYDDADQTVSLKII